MAGAVTVTLVIIGAFLMADVNAASYTLAAGIISSSIRLVDWPEPKIGLKFFVRGSVKPGSSTGTWNLTAYGSATNTINQDGGEQLLSEEDSQQGNNIKAISSEEVLDGMSGCTGFKTYACFTLKRGSSLIASRCQKINIPCEDDLNSNQYTQSVGIVSGTLGFVNDNDTHIIKLKFFVKGNFPPGDSGVWKMSAYGSSSDSPNGTAEVGQILSAADSQQGDTVNFVSDEVVLTGLNGCDGGDNYACFILQRGTETKMSKCFKLALQCGEVTTVGQ